MGIWIVILEGSAAYTDLQGPDLLQKKLLLIWL